MSICAKPDSMLTYQLRAIHARSIQKSSKQNGKEIYLVLHCQKAGCRTTMLVHNEERASRNRDSFGNAIVVLRLFGTYYDKHPIRYFEYSIVRGNVDGAHSALLREVINNSHRLMGPGTAS